MSLFVILGLLLCMEAKGSSAVTPVFVQKGKDLLLEVKTKGHVLVERSEFRWKFKQDKNVVRLFDDDTTIIIDPYDGRAEISVRNYSLLLKNVQQADSGFYSAHIISDKDECVAKYNVTVQDPVSPVGLTVDSVSNSSDSCNLTVTCSTQDSHHISSTFRCDAQTCSQEGGERSEVTTSDASLRVYLVNHSIICNHCNQVSWTKDVNTTEHFCPQHDASENLSAGVSICLVKTVVFSVGLIIMASAVVTVHLMERIKKQKQ